MEEEQGSEDPAQPGVCPAPGLIVVLWRPLRSYCGLVAAPGWCNCRIPQEAVLGAGAQAGLAVLQIVHSDWRCAV